MCGVICKGTKVEMEELDERFLRGDFNPSSMTSTQSPVDIMHSPSKIPASEGNTSVLTCTMSVHLSLPRLSAKPCEGSLCEQSLCEGSLSEQSLCDTSVCLLLINTPRSKQPIQTM